MNFEKFEKDFLSELKNNNKNCLKKINENENIIKMNLGEHANHETVNRFVEELNNAIIIQKKFSLFEKVLKHSSFKRIYQSWKNSNILIKVCQIGNKDACKWILNLDINPRVQDENGRTALMYAVENKSLISIVRKLITNSDCLEILDNNGNNVLFYALHNIEVLNELLRTKINVNHLNKNNETVLLYCCKHDIIEAINSLTVNKDINVNITDDDNKTPAMYLAEYGRYAEMKSLSIRNCNYDYINKKGESILSIVLNKLYNPNEDITVMASNYIRIITTLVQLNCNFNIPVDKDGNTPIMIFMLVNDFDTFCYILTYHKNIDLTVKNYYGESACSLGLKLKNGIFFNRLLKYPTFDLNYIDPVYNNTLLMLTSLTKPELIKEIIEDNVNIVNEVNKRNENALILATKANQIQSVDNLLKYSTINVNQQDDFGNTSLYYAVDLKNLTILHLLLSHQADPNIKNSDGKSALNLAHEIGDKTILNILSDPSTFSENGLKEENSNEPCIKYEEINEYLKPNIKYYNEDYRLTNSIINSMRRVYNNIKANLNYENVRPNISKHYYAETMGLFGAMSY